MIAAEPEISLYHLDEVDSTNSFVKRHVLELADGTLVYADVQTAGRGRMDRKWVSARGNFFGTLLMKKLPDPMLGTMVISLAALDVLKNLAPELDVWLKWPNDIYVENAKLAGVLSEAVIMPDKSRAAVVGIGVNLALSATELATIDKPAASVEKGKINPEKFASELAKSAKMYYIMGMSCSERLFALWRQRNECVGMELTLVLGGDKNVRGVVTAIAPDGALILRDSEGNERSYYCGDVSVDRQSVCAAREKRRQLPDK